MLVFLAYNALGWLGRYAIAAVLGPTYAPVFPNAILMILAISPGLIAYVGMNYALLRKEPAVFTRGVLVGLAVMALACWFLVPRWAAIGATWGTIVGYAALAVVFYARYGREFAAVLPDFWWATMIGLCFVPFYRFELDPAMAAAVYVATSFLYVSILFATRRISFGDARRVLAAFRSKA